MAVPFADLAVESLAAALLSIQVRALLILGAAWLLVRLFRGASAAVRHGVWAVALAGIVALPLTAPWLPRLTIDLPRPDVLAGAASPAGTPGGVEPAGAAGVPARAPGGSPTGLRGATLTPAGAASSPATAAAYWAAVLLAIWVVGAVLRLGWLGLQVMRADRLGGRAHPELGGRWSYMTEQLVRMLGIRRTVRVLESDSVAAPLTWGTIRPIILLPAAANEWTEQRLRLVLLHELAHVRRWDYPVLLLAELACAAYWPNPFVWFARRRVRAEQEQACDNEVLARGALSLDYAEHLLEIARTSYGSRHQFGAAVSMARETSLKHRIRAILDEGINRRPLASLSGMAAMLLLVGIALPTALVRAAIPAHDAHADIGTPVRPSAGDAAPRAADAQAAGQEAADPPAADARASGPQPAGTRAADPEATAPEAAYPTASMRAAAETFLRFEAGRATLRPPIQDRPDIAGSTRRLSYVWFESEDAVLQMPMRVARSAAASGERYIQVPPAPMSRAGGSATFRFTVVQSGAYVIWGRVRAPNDGANSFYVSVAGAAQILWDVPGPDPDETTDDWEWDPVSARDLDGRTLDPLVFDLEPGQHVLRVRSRESGTELDGILITNDLLYRPRGVGPMLPPARAVHVRLEAESAILEGPFRIRRDERAGGRRFVEVVTQVSSEEVPPSYGSALFRFDVPLAGAYLVWARTKIEHDGEDSFWVRANDGRWIQWNEIDDSDDWEWSAIHDSRRDDMLVRFELAQGENTIELTYRESGASIDRLLVTNDPRYEPG